MFRKILGGAVALLLSAATLAQAAIVGPLPFTLTNGSVADASQVMANFNKIVNDVNNNVIFPSFTQQNYYAVDNGSANTLVVTLSPAPSQYVPGMVINVKVAAANTGASTINANVLGSQNVVNVNGSPLKSQQLLSGAVAQLVYDGVQFELLNLTPLAVRQSAVSRTTVTVTASGAWTFTIPVGVYAVQVEQWGGGGGGGGGTGSSADSGAGGSGAYGLSLLTVNPGDVLSGVIGAGGVGGTTGGTAGTTGGATTLLVNGSTLCTTNGGVGAASGNIVGGGALGGSASGTSCLQLTGSTGSPGFSGFNGGIGGTAPRGGVGGAPGSGSGGNPGGGGGGAGGNTVGGAGAGGWIFLEY